jgi:hypothetical protein
MRSPIKYDDVQDVLEITIEDRKVRNEFCLRTEPIKGVLKLELDVITGNLLKIKLIGATWLLSIRKSVLDHEGIVPATIYYEKEDDTLRISLREDNTGEEGCDLIWNDHRRNMMVCANRTASGGSLTGFELVGFSKMVHNGLLVNN